MEFDDVVLCGVLYYSNLSIYIIILSRYNYYKFMRTNKTTVAKNRQSLIKLCGTLKNSREIHNSRKRDKCKSPGYTSAADFYLTIIFVGRGGRTRVGKFVCHDNALKCRIYIVAAPFCYYYILCVYCSSITTDVMYTRISLRW